VLGKRNLRESWSSINEGYLVTISQLRGFPHLVEGVSKKEDLKRPKKEAVLREG